jgi:hypothetical protein
MANQLVEKKLAHPSQYLACFSMTGNQASTLALLAEQGSYDHVCVCHPPRAAQPGFFTHRYSSGNRDYRF